jgi:GntR family transcriptional regulator
MTQTLHPEEPTPLYYQLEMALRHAIERGLFPDGRLPTERELVEQYAVSRLTVRSALRRLEDEGIIERHRARGTFVRPDALAKLVRDPVQWTFEEYIRRHTGSRTNRVLSIEKIESPAGVAATLGLAQHEQVWRILRLGSTDDEPLFLERRYYPLDVGAKLVSQDLTGRSVSEVLEEVLGVRIGSKRMRIDASVANSSEARYLNVRKGHPLLVCEFTSYDAEGRAIQLLQAAFRGDRYAVAMTLPELSSARMADVPTSDGATDYPTARLVNWELIGANGPGPGGDLPTADPFPRA